MSSTPDPHMTHPHQRASNNDKHKQDTPNICRRISLPSTAPLVHPTSDFHQIISSEHANQMPGHQDPYAYNELHQPNNDRNLPQPYLATSGRGGDPTIWGERVPSTAERGLDVTYPLLQSSFGISLGPGDKITKFKRTEPAEYEESPSGDEFEHSRDSFPGYRQQPNTSEHLTLCSLLPICSIGGKDRLQDQSGSSWDRNITTDEHFIGKTSDLSLLGSSNESPGKIPQDNNVSPLLCRRDGRTSNTSAISEQGTIPAKPQVLLGNNRREGPQDPLATGHGGPPCQPRESQPNCRCLRNLPRANEKYDSGEPTPQENYQPKYINLDCRLLRDESRPFCLKPIRIDGECEAPTKEVSFSGKGKLPMDPTKLKHLEKVLESRGLSLHTNFPLVPSIEARFKETEGIKQPLAFLMNYAGLDPPEYLHPAARVLRWVFLFVGGNDMVYEFDNEMEGWMFGGCGTIEEVDHIARTAASVLGDGTSISLFG